MLTKVTVLYKLKTESNVEDIPSNFWDPEIAWANNYTAYRQLRSESTIETSKSFSSNATHVIKTLSSTYADLNSYIKFQSNTLVKECQQTRKDFNDLNNIQLKRL